MRLLTGVGVILIVQGVFDDIEESAKKYSEAKALFSRIIFSTWKGMVSSEQLEDVRASGIEVVLSDDPGSIKAYTFKGINKFLNIDRQQIGLLSAMDVIAPDEILVRLRTDAVLDVQKLGRAIERCSDDILANKIVVTNVTTIFDRYIPTAFKALHICDWIYIGKKEVLVSFFRSKKMNEALIQENFKFENDNKVYSPLAAEQVLPFFWFCELNGIDCVELYDDVDSYKIVIREFLKQKFIVLSNSTLGLRSAKYLAISGRYKRVPDYYFQERGTVRVSIKIALGFLFGWAIHVAVMILELLRVKKLLLNVLRLF